MNATKERLSVSVHSYTLFNKLLLLVPLYDSQLFTADV